MNKKFLLTLVCVPLLLASCSKSSSDNNNPTPEPTPTPTPTPGPGPSPEPEPGPIPDDDLEKYMKSLADNSLGNHFYYHYLRTEQTASDYNKWDVWTWPYRPNEDEGVRFDWVGRTTSEDKMSATGNASIDSFGYVNIDVDLTKTYGGGWDNKNKKMLDLPINYLPEGKVTSDVQIGVQIVESATRTSSSGFWNNDGGNVYILLEDYALTNTDGSTSYHAFVYKDNAKYPSAKPVVNASTIDDPFKHDDGTNVTYGDNKYITADWNDKALQPTASSFQNDGVGYQIMVSSFADSDKDGFGDIYGIEQQLDYIQSLGVSVLWLTPIQQSDSYHGYDITDYLKVDEKFASKVSPAAQAAGGRSEETAMKDYKSLLDAAHARGMKVIMDLVLNHTSTSNVWFVESAKLSETMRGYYQWGNHETDSANINQDKYWYPYGDHCYSYYAKFGSAMPELNYAYADTRTAVETMAKNWCEIGVDGFRMDAVKHIFIKDEIAYDGNDTYIKDVSVNPTTGKTQDYSSDLTKNLNFWREINYSIKQDYPNAFFVGENFDGHAYHVSPFYEGFDSLFDFYSYFNFTSLASRYAHGGSSGAYIGDASQFIGEAADPYTKSSDKDLEGNTKSIKFEGKWNLADVLNTNNKYRTGGSSATAASGYSMIDGAFTSNHDIARAINRVAGTSFNNSGLTAQGSVSKNDYSTFENYATLVEISELMLPGITWIYYGDELGMTGNFLDGKTADDGYSDLAYRQPMKWVANGQVGDGSMTTGYKINGSGTSVKWDEVNASSHVPGAEAQVKDSNSHFSNIAKFASLKTSSQTLIKGLFAPYYGDITNAGTKASVISFTRTLGDESYRLVVNLGDNPVNISSGGTLALSYGTASTSSVGARSAALIKLSGAPVGDTKYSIIIGGRMIEAPTNPFNENESMALGVEAHVGEELQVHDNESGATWTIQNLDPASKGFKSEGGKIVCIEDGTYDMYIKWSYGNDQIYIGYAG